MKTTNFLPAMLALMLLVSSAYAVTDSPETVPGEANNNCMEAETETTVPNENKAAAEITSSTLLISAENTDAEASLSLIHAVSPVQGIEISHPAAVEHYAGYSEPQLRTKPAYMQSYNQNGRKNRNSVKKNIFIITAVNAIIIGGVSSMLVKSDNNNYKIGGAGI